MAPPACTRCGSRLDAGARFCSQCGQSVSGTVSGARRDTESRSPATPVPGAVAAVPAPAVAAPAGRGLRLVPIGHDGRPGAPWPIAAPGVLAGRSDGELRFEGDRTLSLRHARFVVRNGRAEVEDLGSLNGTFLRLRAARTLGAGDELRLGRQVLRLEPVPRREDTGTTRPWGGADPGHRWRLVQLLDGGGTGEVFPLRDGENTVGREVGHVTFPADRYVSARHARLEVQERAITLTDLGSSNGTFVRLTAPAPLSAGDQVLLGMQLIRVE